MKQYQSHIVALSIGSIGTMIIIGAFSINLCGIFNNCTQQKALEASQEKIKVLDANLTQANALAKTKADSLEASLRRQQQFSNEIDQKIKESHERLQHITGKMDKVIEKARFLNEIMPILSDYIRKH